MIILAQGGNLEQVHLLNQYHQHQSVGGKYLDSTSDGRPIGNLTLSHYLHSIMHAALLCS